MITTHTTSAFGKAFRVFGAGLLAVGVLAVQALGQPGPAKKAGNTAKPGEAKADDKTKKFVAAIKAPAASVKFNTEALRTHKKAVVAHKAFKLLHPETKKEVAGDHMLTLPDGKKVKAEAYYAELNMLEKKL